MTTHGGNQRFCGYPQKFFIKTTQHRVWPFDQAGHFIEQTRLHHRSTTQGGRQGINLINNQLLANAVIGHHMGLLQALQITIRICQSDIMIGVKTMTPAFPSGIDTKQFKLNHRTTQQGDNPMYGPHKFTVAGAPAHATVDR